ncbi:MAG: shikimate kinase [Candidatus Thermoplasmatota archaeon]|jgi:shikimate kinase|nr:shikimate kinase [Candidatus Thermoplasmatota archaeon]MCL5791362.1 shikimate kinase [Candidatus Thermoplasmatota archaeon]
MAGREVRVTTNSGISVVSGFVNGKGAAVSLDLGMVISLRESESTGNDKNVNMILDNLKERYGGIKDLSVRVLRRLPSSQGLKSSSAIAGGIMLGYAALNGIDLTDEQILRDGSELSRELKMSATGATDDLASSVIGGLCITDNYKGRMIKRQGVEEKPVIILTTNRKRESFRFGNNDFSFLRRAYDDMWERVNRFNYEYTAIINGNYMGTLSGSSLDYEKLRDLNFSHAGVNGKGPSVFLIYRNGNDRSKDISVLKGRNIKFISTRLTNRGAGVEWVRR